MKRFDVVEHTADTGIVAYGADLKEAFANAAYAMFTLIADLEGVREDVRRPVKVESEDLEGLLVDWLNELLYVFEVERTIFRRFEISELSNTGLKAEVCGETMDPPRHRLRSGVKAATYHMLNIDRDHEYSVRVIFDT